MRRIFVDSTSKSPTGLGLFIGWMAISLAVMLICSPIAMAAQPDTRMLIVVGAPGSEEYGKQFRDWAKQWLRVGELAGAKIVQIGSDADQKENDLDRLREQLTIVRPNWLILIGHGTYQAAVAKFNLRGPDISAEELARLLEPIKHPLVIVNVAAASGPFVNALSGPNRIVVTATKSGEEQNFARFGAYLPTALGDRHSDLDHDDEVSLLEAVIKATSETNDFYASDDRILTEHAILDDNGDSLGTPAELLGDKLIGKPGMSVLPPTKGSSPPAVDGDAAAKTILVPAKDLPSLTSGEMDERARIETELTALRKRKQSLSETEYFEQLEKLMLELAKIYRQAEERAKLPASSP